MEIPTVEFQPRDLKKNNVEVISLDSVYKRSDKLEVNPFKPHRVEFHHLIYITGGIGTHFIDFNSYPCREGSFIFVNKKQVHSFDFDNQPQGLSILFTQEFIDSIRVSIRVPVFSSGFYTGSDTPVLTVDHALKESCEALFSEIENVTGSKLYDPLILQLLFTSLLLKLHREKPDSIVQQLSEAQRQQFSLFKSLMDIHFTSTRDASAYAKIMGTTYKSLHQLCKIATNQTPKQLIDAHTILEAKRRLAIENIQVTQLAYEIGFEEVSNFVKYFKKQTLVTPEQFKESLKR